MLDFQLAMKLTFIILCPRFTTAARQVEVSVYFLSGTYATIAATVFFLLACFLEPGVGSRVVRIGSTAFLVQRLQEAHQTRV